jgi:hypothetical protein
MAVNKRAGKKSLAQNDFLQPSTPNIGTATDVGTGRAFNDGAASVTFSLPENSPAATSYTVTSTPGSFSASGASSPIIVGGLASTTSYTFTVTAANASGVSGASSASNSITATTVPATMSAPSVSSPSGANYDTVSWSAPANGGKAISLYRYTSSDGKTGTTASTSVNVTQEQGTSQTYQIRAENANGAGVYSANSASVTTFSFVPFSVFGFFGFQPFSVFGFFAVFGFFGFAPWYYDG